MHTHTHNHFMALYPGLPEWAGTRRNIYPLTPFLLSRYPFLYQIPPSTTIYSILPAQFMCLTVFLHNLHPSPLWSGALSFISIHFFTQSHARTIVTCFAVVLRLSSIPSLSLNSLLETLSFTYKKLSWRWKTRTTHAKYSVLHHMIIKQFLLLAFASYGNQTIPSTRPIAAEYRSRR